jgi:hypothetical protein
VTLYQAEDQVVRSEKMGLVIPDEIIEATRVRWSAPVNEA